MNIMEDTRFPDNHRILLFTVEGGSENGGWDGKIFSYPNGSGPGFYGEVFLSHHSSEESTPLILRSAPTEAELITTLIHLLQEKTRELQELTVTIDLASSLCPNPDAIKYLDRASRSILAAEPKTANQHLLKALLTDTNFVLPNADQTLNFRFGHGSVSFKIPKALTSHISMAMIPWESPIIDMIQEVGFNVSGTYWRSDSFNLNLTLSSTLVNQNEIDFRIRPRRENPV